MPRDSLSHRLTTSRSRLERYGIAVLLTAVATMFRLALTPLIGEYAIPYTMFFPAVLLSAWYGGLSAAILTVLLSTASAFWFFVYPARTLQIPNPTDRIALLVFLVVGIGMGLLSRSQRAAQQRAAREASQRRRAELSERLEITQHIQTHETLLERNAEVLKQSEQLQLAAEGSQMGLWVWDEVTRELFWDAREREMLGAPPDGEVTLETFREAIHPDDAERVMREWRHAFEQRLPYQTEYRSLSPDGTTRWMYARGSGYYDDTARPMRMVGVTFDITERKESEQERLRLEKETMARQRAAEEERQARLAAEETNRAKDEFLATVSHELRSPLSSVIGWVVMLKQGQVPQERVPHVLDVIERNVRAESQLVESLLDYSRIAADKMDLNFEGIDLSYLLEMVVDSIRPAAKAKSVVVGLTPADKPLVVVGDSARLQQVFSNLLTNALKFTPRDGRVQVRLARRESEAEVQVVDNGEGIQSDVLPHIFERFRQADSAKGRAHGGLGLGLAIVRELAEAHGGTVSAESQGKGLGSTFTVRIPIPATLPDNIRMAAAHPAAEPVISGLRILVVDDESDARELVTLALESRGVEVRQASSAGEALDALGRQKPDLVISDIGMPHEDGYALVRTLRAAERDNAQPRLPAIALTAYSSTADRDEAMAAGFDLHLAKPVALADLVRAIGSVSREKATKSAA